MDDAGHSELFTTLLKGHIFSRKLAQLIYRKLILSSASEF